MTDTLDMDGFLEEYERHEKNVADLDYYFDNQPINVWENDNDE